jgi:hypothetical protein
LLYARFIVAVLTGALTRAIRRSVLGGLVRLIHATTSLSSPRSPPFYFGIAGPDCAIECDLMPLTLRLSASQIALFAAIAILPVPAQVFAEPGAAPLAVVAVQEAAVTNATPATADANAPDAAEVAEVAIPDIAAADIECVAKVVLHEAGNQPRAGQLAVAHVVINRAESRRFPENVCDVANQPGQFFRLASYNPARTTAVWRAAVDAARAALSGKSSDMTKGAIFFRSAASRPDRFFQSRQRVIQLHDQIFYR